MTTTRPKLKRGVTNVIIDKLYVGWASLTLQYILRITPSYRYTGQIRLSKMMQVIEKQLKNIPMTW